MAFGFLLLVALSAFLFLSRKWKPRTKIVALTALTCVTVFVVVYRHSIVTDTLTPPSGVQVGGGALEPPPLDPVWLKQVGLFLSMLLGMASKYLWDQIERRKQRNAHLRSGEPKHRLEFDFWDFVQPLCVAGIVFLGVLNLTPEMRLTAFLFSFQNGFFWQTVLAKRGNELAHVASQTASK